MSEDARLVRRRNRIAVLDSSPATLELVRYLLERQGYEVFPFTQIQSAVAFLKANPVDVIVTDSFAAQDHPDPLDGLEPLLAVAGQAKIVFCSRHPLARSVVDSRIAQIIQRPFDVADFLTRLTRLTETSSSEREH